MKHRWISILASVVLVVGLATLSTPKPALAVTITSAQSGNWDSVSTWVGGVVPQAGEDVIIAAGHTVTVNVNTASLASITVNGTLRFDNSGIGKSMTVTGDVTINSGGTLDVATDGSDTTHSLTIGGNVTNDGTLDCLPATGRIINVTFNKNGNQTISGSGTTRFNNLTLNMGTSKDNVLDVQAVITMAAGGLTLTNGTFKLSSASTITPFAGSTTIGSTAGFYLNHASAVSNWGTSGSLKVNGALTIADGTMTVGSGSGNELEVNGTSATATVSGGTLKIAGRVRTVSSGLLTISGGEIVVPTVGQSSGEYASFYMQSTGRLTMSGGTVTIERANGGAGGDIKIVSDSKSITGGTFQIGNASTPGSQIILIDSAIAVNHLTVNSANATARLSAALTANGNINIVAGALDANNLNLTIGGNWTNSGTFTADTGTVTFNGTSTQTIGGSSTTTFNNLTINNSAGVTLSTDTTVNGTLALTSGDLTTGSNTLTMGSSATSSGSSDVVGNVTRSGFSAGSTYNFGNPNVSLNFASGGTLPSSVTVNLAKSAPSGFSNAVQRTYTISQSGGSGFSATLRLHYLDSELGSNTEADLSLWRKDDTTWSNQGRTGDVNTTDNWVELSGVTTLSDWTLASSGPTAITLSSLTARPFAPQATLFRWQWLALAGAVVFCGGAVARRLLGR